MGCRTIEYGPDVTNASGLVTRSYALPSIHAAEQFNATANHRRTSKPRTTDAGNIDRFAMLLDITNDLVAVQ